MTTTQMTDYDPILTERINARFKAAKKALTAQGLNYLQWTSTTCSGNPRVEGCELEDTILNKVVAGALTAEGAARILGLR